MTNKGNSNAPTSDYLLEQVCLRHVRVSWVNLVSMVGGAASFIIFYPF
ncbi:hypothetical protein VP150E351_P0045 [Vibrio phage 150E35-1]|nr:hypothetical protein VP150E351_P0045 [Vibrio phage 150E35-1]